MAAVVVVGLVLHFAFSDSAASSSASLADPSKDAIALAQQRLTRLRQIAATGPAREAVMKQVSAILPTASTGSFRRATAAEAQATLLEIARRIGKDEQIDVRGGELGAPKAFGDYGLVSATITFECHIEQLVNFLADLSRVPELIVPSEERITSGNRKIRRWACAWCWQAWLRRNSFPKRKVWRGFETEAHCAERVSARGPRGHRMAGARPLGRRAGAAAEPFAGRDKTGSAAASETRAEAGSGAARPNIGRRDQRLVFERPESERGRGSAEGGTTQADAAAAGRVMASWGCPAGPKPSWPKKPERPAERFMRAIRSANSRSFRWIRRTSYSTGMASRSRARSRI